MTTNNLANDSFAAPSDQYLYSQQSGAPILVKKNTLFPPVVLIPFGQQHRSAPPAPRSTKRTRQQASDYKSERLSPNPSNSKFWRTDSTGHYNDYEVQALNIFGLEIQPAPRRSLLNTFTDSAELMLGDEDLLSKSFLSSLVKIPDDFDKIVRISEDVITLIYGLIRSRSRADRYMAIFTYVKLRGSRFDIVTMLMVAFSETFGLLLDSTNKMDIQSDEFFADARSYLDSYDNLKGTKIFKKLYKFGMYALSLSLFTKLGIDFELFSYSQIEAEAIKRKYYKGPDLVHCILDTALFICERGYQCVKTRTLSPIFHSGTSYEKWYERANKLKIDSRLLTNPEPHNINRFQFLADLKDTIEKGESIKKFSVALDVFEKKSIATLLDVLKTIHGDELTKRAAMQERKAPFSVLIYGGSSVAKSLLTNVMFVHYGKLYGLPTSNEFMYTRNPAEEFWSLFNSTQWCLRMDDIAFLAPSLGVLDPTMSELLLVSNNTPFVPLQADLPDKGRTPFNGELVLATSNTEHLNVHAYFSCPLAVSRRLPFIIETTPKQQYMKHGCMIDGSKLPIVPDGEYPDFWDFIVKKVVPAHDKIGAGAQAKTEEVARFTNINDFLEWFRIECDDHRANQAKALVANSSIQTVKLCVTCHRVISNCVCTVASLVDREMAMPHEEEDAISVRERFSAILGRDLSVQSEEVLPSWMEESIEIPVTVNDLPAVVDVGLLPSWMDDLPPSPAVIEEESPNLIRPPEATWWYTFRHRLFLVWRDICCADCWNDREHTCRVTGHVHVGGGPTLPPYDASMEDEAVLGLESPLFQTRMWLYIKILTYANNHWWFSFFMCWWFGEAWKYRLGMQHFSQFQTLRVIFRCLGHRVQNQIGLPKILVGIYAVTMSALTLATIYKAFSAMSAPTAPVVDPNAKFYGGCNPKNEDCGNCGHHTRFKCHDKCSNPKQCETLDCLSDSEEEEVNLAHQTDVGVTPADRGEKRAFYQHDPYRVTSTDLSPTSRAYQVSTDLPGHIRRNAVTFISSLDAPNSPDARHFKVNAATNIFDHVYLANNHGIPATTPFFLTVISSPTTQCVGASSRDILVTEGMILRVPEKDLVFIEIRHRPPGYDLSPYFAASALQGKFVGQYIGIDRSGEHFSRKCHNVVDGVYLKDNKHQVPIWFAKVEIPTAHGDCGSMMISDTIGMVILGIHYLGKDKIVGAIKVFDSDVALARERFARISCARGTIPISAPSAPRTLVGLDPKSPVLWTQSGTANVFGSFKGWRPRRTSSVSATLIQNSMIKRGVPVQFGAPMFDWRPWFNAFSDMSRPVTQMNTDILKVVTDDFIDDILLGLTDDDLSRVQVFDDRTALNGAEGIKYCDKINRSTSTGAPYKKSKALFLEFKIDARGEYVEALPEIMDRVDVILETYMAGRRFHPQFCGNLKDEPIKFKKIESGKVRVFCGSEFAWSIVVRKYLLSFIMLVQNNRFLFESGPGTIAQSLEWEEIREYLTTHGSDRMVAGDYAAFDKRMPATVILAAFDIILSVCKRAGYSEEDLKVVMGVGIDTAFPNVDFHGDLIEFFGSNPSGHPLTVIINGLANSLYMRYCYAVASGTNSAKDFKKNVALMTYGDDNIMGVAPECGFFNHTAIQRVLSDIDIQYTMADKEAVSVPFIHINDCSFLKRTWRWDEDVGAYLAPLDHTSIEKMVTVCVRGKTISPEAHAIAVISTAVREYFFYGKKTFELKVAMFRDVVVENDLEHYVEDSTFPLWEDLRSDFYDNSTHVNLKRGADTPYRHQCLKLVECGRCLHTLARRLTPSCILHLVSNTQNEERDCGFAQTGGRTDFCQYMGDLSPSIHSRKECYVCECAYEPRDTHTNICNDCAELLDVQGDVMEEPVLSASSGMSQTVAQNVQFNDSAPGMTAGLDRGYDGVSAADQTENMDFVKFLSRPVRIGAFTWNEADAVGTSHTFNPWNLYFTDTRVKYKLNNFAFIQCKLKVKVLINASPFYYGAMYMGYQPLPTLTPSTIVNDTGTRYLIPYSQRPHIWINPQNNEAGEMTLPYFNQANWINAQSAQAMTDMGQLTFLNYTTLASANGVVGTGVSIAIYAWAEDVKLSGPSIGLATQCDEYEEQADEYGNGVVSTPASAIASAAKWFEKIPIIGRFATATRIGASAVSSIASLFGFTNVPVVADTHPFRPEAFPKFASTEIGFPIEKLTLDPKNELSVDPSIIGLDPTDEMVISHLVQRESYLTTTVWSTTNAIDDILFTSRVMPNLYDNDNGTSPKIYMTPMSWISSLFRSWRGDIIFKFKIVASVFHKGRLRISFDPAGYTAENITTDAASANVVFTSIVDLGESNEVEFRVPYQQATAFLLNPNNLLASQIPWSTSLTPPFNRNGLFDNGTITVRVQTTLTAPVATSAVSILVFVRAAENLEFANPTNLSAFMSSFQVQSGEYTESSITAPHIIGTDTPNTVDERYLMNFGESVKSLRQLFRRSTLVSTAAFNNTAAVEFSILQKTFGKIPGMYGYDPNGINAAHGIVVPATIFQFNYSQMIPLTWILPGFITYRGSTHWTFNVEGPAPVGHIRVHRVNYNTTATASEITINSIRGTQSFNAAFFVNNCPPGSSGQALTNQQTNAGMNVSCPMYSNFRMESTNPANYTKGIQTDGSNLDFFQLEVMTDSVSGVSDVGVRVWSYNSIGTDFGCHFFLNVPVMWQYGLPIPN